MDLSTLVEIAKPLGPAAPFIVYFFWRDHVRDKREERRETRDAEMQKDRIEADKQLASAMTLLAAKVG